MTSATAIEQTSARVHDVGLVPVVELPNLKLAKPLVEALCAGGLPVAEITLPTPEATEAVELLTKDYPEVLIGAGTVLSVDYGVKVVAAGAKFVISPGTDTDLVALCNGRAVLAMPGVCAPTEVRAALRVGDTLLKFFPAEASGGTPCLKALAGSFSKVGFVPTGGVNAGDLASYLALPQVAACGGSWTLLQALLASGDFAKVTGLASKAFAIVASARGQGSGTPNQKRS